MSYRGAPENLNRKYIQNDATLNISGGSRNISDAIIKAEQVALKHHFKKKLVRDFLIVGSSLSGMDDIVRLFRNMGLLSEWIAWAGTGSPHGLLQ